MNPIYIILSYSLVLDFDFAIFKVRSRFLDYKPVITLFPLNTVYALNLLNFHFYRSPSRQIPYCQWRTSDSILCP